MSDSLQVYRSLLAHLYGDDRLEMVKRPVSGSSHGLLYAVDRDSHRHLLLPIDDHYAFKQVDGESLRLRDTTGADGTRYMDLSCVSNGYREVFAALVDDIVRRLSQGDVDGPAQIQKALGEWRRLLKPAQEMSPEASRGLFGELVVLGWLASRNAPFALESWTGPSGGFHDFSTPNGDIEVKTSAKEGLDVDVSSLRQLDVSSTGDLTLVRLSVAETQDGQNMSDMVEALADLGVQKWPLVQKLDDAGFKLGVSHDSTRYQMIVAPCAWHVALDFPALRYGSLDHRWRDAITKVRYTLDLATAPGRLEDDEFQAVMDRMMSH